MKLNPRRRMPFNFQAEPSIVYLPNTGGMVLPMLAARDFLELEFVHNASPSLQAKMARRLLELRVREWTAAA